ncbi:GATA transcription factor 18-like [Aristolochia californica]|uniref:GATA transcription factor 18-like n=1 Tax=Aristolochia californica TaxID=171875 RepID=UPI0035DC1E89
MHRCSSGGGGGSCSSPIGPCACGLFHASGSSFSVLFAMPADENNEHFEGGGPSTVDCTLSLGTPSTRRGDDIAALQRQHRPGTSCLSNFCWDILQARQQEGAAMGPHKSGRGGSSSMQFNNLGGETLLARRCANCDTTSTPLWRNGPRGPKSLCNACGIRYKKEERRASSTVVEMNNQHTDPYSWSYAPTSQSHKAAASSAEFRLIRDDDDGNNSPDVSFLSWRLNVRDRAGLLHDFT